MGLPNITPVTVAGSLLSNLSNLLLVSPQNTIGYQPQPKQEQAQQPTFLFDYEGEQTAILESDITDHYIEDNTAIQDQIALKPIMVTTHGYIGELTDIAPSFLLPLKKLADKLTIISGYVPSLSVSALLVYNQAFFAAQVVASAANTLVSGFAALSGTGGESTVNGNVITKQSVQNKQQTAFQTFFGYWTTRTLFTIQTPWVVFQNMAISRLRAIQDERTNVITDFEITFKGLRFVDTAIGKVITAGEGSRLQSQSSALEQNGTVPTGADVEQRLS